MTNDQPQFSAKDCSCQERLAGETLPMFTPPKGEDEVCCGPKTAFRSTPFEKPGYRVCAFVEEFIPTSLGPVPKIKTHLNARDRLGSIGVRLGFNRNNYKVSPGLYALGHPDSDSVILVTANYKLSFDTLRQEISDLNAWVLVLDTRGVNVWCAAGKKTFSSAEVIRQVKINNLDQLVSHRKLILPQLSATGVSAVEVKRGCGFEVIWGPIQARDIKPFLAAGFQAEKAMRQVTFGFWERLVLTPVEMTLVGKHLLWMVPILFILSGFGPKFFSFSAFWYRGLAVAVAVILGVFSGTVLTPALLPWIPFRAFSLKGAVTGLISGMILIGVWFNPVIFCPALALLLLIMTLSSYLAMNFTGCTPFTSPSGVEKEMRKALPFQSAAAGLGLILWIISAFLEPRG